MLGGMSDSGEISDLFPEARNPSNVRAINSRCMIRTQEGHIVVLVSGVILAQYVSDDPMAQAHAMVSLVEQGLADQIDVARAFGCAARTVRRHQQRFAEGGLAALGRKRGYPSGRARLLVSRQKRIERLKPRAAAAERSPPSSESLSALFARSCVGWGGMRRHSHKPNSSWMTARLRTQNCPLCRRRQPIQARGRLVRGRTRRLREQRNQERLPPR